MEFHSHSLKFRESKVFTKHYLMSEFLGFPPQCGFLEFFAIQILREFNFSLFQKVKNGILTILGPFDFFAFGGKSKNRNNSELLE